MGNLFDVENKKRAADLERQALAIWKEYPRKIGRKQALPAIMRTIKRQDITADELKKRTQFFAHTMAELPLTFVPHGSTWFRQERWADEDFVTKYQRSRRAASDTEIDFHFCQTARSSLRVWEECGRQCPVSALETDAGIWKRRRELAERSPTLRALLR